MDLLSCPGLSPVEPWCSPCLTNILILQLRKQRPSGTRIRSQVAEFPLCFHLHDLIDLLGIYLTCEDAREKAAFHKQEENSHQKMTRLVL